MRRTERGFALIQVLLVFALLAIIVARLQYQQRIQIERASQGLFLSQAQTCIDSAEAVAKTGLRLEAQQDDAQLLDESGNLQLPLVVLGGCRLSIELNDLQGRFNLNWLHPAAANPEAAAAGFKRLLLELELDEGIADELLEWFDADSGAQFNYMDQTPSYRPSFMPLADVSELHLLKAVGQEDFAVLAPYVAALKPAEPLNINTAASEVLMTLAPFISRDDADDLVTQRGSEGFSQVDELLNQPLFQENDDTPLYNDQLAVTSSWFDLYVEAQQQRSSLRQISRLYRADNAAVIVNFRTQAVHGPNTSPATKEEGSTE